MFVIDNGANKEKLVEEIKDKKAGVISGAGSIGSNFIKTILRFEPKSVMVIDLNENGLTEFVRDVRSTNGLNVPNERAKFFFTSPMKYMDYFTYIMFNGTDENLKQTNVTQSTGVF